MEINQTKTQLENGGEKHRFHHFRSSLSSNKPFSSLLKTIKKYLPFQILLFVISI